VKIKVIDGTTEHNTQEYDKAWFLPQAAVLAEVGKALIDINSHLSEFCRTHEMFKYVDEIGVDAIVMSWAGEPMGVVQYLDDEPTFMPFTSAKAERLTAAGVNTLAQRFYEASNLHEIPMTSKDRVVKGLQAVLREIGVDFEEQEIPGE
jgi:hypothetical protein